MRELLSSYAKTVLPNIIATFCSPALSKAVLTSMLAMWYLSPPCQVSRLLSSCHSQCFCSSCAIITWWHPSPPTPPTCNCLPSSVALSRRTTNQVAYHFDITDASATAPETSDPRSWFCVWRSQESFCNSPRAGSYLPDAREAGLETSRDLVNHLLTEFLDHLRGPLTLSSASLALARKTVSTVSSACQCSVKCVTLSLELHDPLLLRLILVVENFIAMPL